jgi:putative PEP-CTERM system TPR-repeat lipoprotein
MIVRRVFSVSALILLATLISACSGESGVDEKVRYERALNALQGGDTRAAVIDLKSILQQNPVSADARFLMGKIYVRLGFGPDAEKELRRALESGVSREEVLPYLGRALLLQNHSEELLSEISVELSEKNAALLALQSEAYLMQGGYEESRRLIKQALALDLNHEVALLSAAKLALAEKNIVAARGYLDDTLAVNNKNSHAWFLKGGVDFMDGRLELAEISFRNAVESEPENMATNLVFLANAGLARANIAQGKHEEAQARIDGNLLKLAPAHPLPNYLRALVSYQLGDYAASELYLRKVLKVAPNDRGGILLLGAVSYHQGKFEQANVYLENFNAAMPGYLPAQKLLAATKISLQQLEGAMDILKPVLAETPDDAQLFELIGGVALQLGDAKGARRYLSQAIKNAPGNSNIRAKLASAHLFEGNFDLAIKELEAAGSYDDLGSAGELALAMAYVQNREFVKARRLVERIVAEQPRNFSAHQLMAHLAEVDGDGVLARRHFELALDLEPDNVNLILLVARKELAAGRLKRTRVLLEKVLELDVERIEAAVLLAYVEGREGRWEEAFALATAVTGRKDKAVIGFELEGNLFMLRENFKAAFESYDSAVRLGGGELLVIKRHQAQRHLDVNEAIILLEEWVVRNPDKFRAKMTLATEYMNKAQNSKAEVYFKSILDVEPKNWIVLNNLAWLYLERRDVQAIALAKRAYEIRPESADILDTYGWVMVQLGDKRRGLELIEKSFEINPDNAAIRHHLQIARQLVE